MVLLTIALYLEGIRWPLNSSMSWIRAAATLSHARCSTFSETPLSGKSSGMQQEIESFSTQKRDQISSCPNPTLTAPRQILQQTSRVRQLLELIRTRIL